MSLCGVPVSFRFVPTLVLFCCGDGKLGIGGMADGPEFFKGLVFTIGLLFSCCEWVWKAAIFNDLFHDSLDVVRARAVYHQSVYVSFTKLTSVYLWAGGAGGMVSQMLQNSTTWTFIFNNLYLCSTTYIYIQHFIFIFNNTHFLSTSTKILFIQQKNLFNFNQK